MTEQPQTATPGEPATPDVPTLRPPSPWPAAAPGTSAADHAAPMPAPPTAPPLPPAATTPANRQPRKRLILFVTGGVVALLLLGVCVAVAVAAFTRSRYADSSVDAAGGLNIAWTVERPASGGDIFAGRALGSWQTGDLVVRVQADGVLAYKLSNGAQAWGTPVPDGASMCAATPTADHDLAAISFGPPDRCDKVAGIDLRTGTIAWTVTVPATVAQGRNDRRAAPLLAVSGGTVVVEASDSTDPIGRGRHLLGFGAGDGQQRWQVTPDRLCAFKGLSAADNTAVVGLDCLSKAVAGLDVATGQQRWRTPLPDGSVEAVVSAAPPIVLMLPHSSDGEALAVFDDSGRLATTVPETLGGATLALTPALGVPGAGDRYRFLVRDTTLYIPTRPNGKDDAKGQILAIDLTTGTRRWAASTSGVAVNLIRADDQGLLAFDSGVGLDHKPQLIRIAAKTGKITSVTDAPIVVGTSTWDAAIYEHNGTVVILPSNGAERHAIMALKRRS